MQVVLCKPTPPHHAVFHASPHASLYTHGVSSYKMFGEWNVMHNWWCWICVCTLLMMYIFWWPSNLYSARLKRLEASWPVPELLPVPSQIYDGAVLLAAWQLVSKGGFQVQCWQNLALLLSWGMQRAQGCLQRLYREAWGRKSAMQEPSVCNDHATRDRTYCQWESKTKDGPVS